jgi:hypothetical protein
MMSSTCYQIRAGRITATEIPAAGLPLLTTQEVLGVHMLAIAGGEDADWEPYTLSQVAEIATRLTPWATWHCSQAWRPGAAAEPPWHLL